MKRLSAILLILSLVILSVFSLASCDSSEVVKPEGKKAYILAEKGNTYSLGLANNFKIAFEKKGGSTMMETYPAGTQGFSDYLKNAVNEKVDVIFVPNSATMAPDFLKNAVDLGINIPILAGDTWESSIVLDAVKDTELEVYCSTFFDEKDSSSIALEFSEGFKKFVKNNSEYYDMNGSSDIVTAVSALGYDAYNVAIAAIRAAAEEKGAELTSADIARALWSTDVDGVTGNIRFDKNGDAIKNSAYIKRALNDGSGFEYVITQSVSFDMEPAKAPQYSDRGISIDKDNKRITIGVYEPLSGENSVGGKQEVVGIRYAHSLDHNVEIDGEEYSVDLYVMDNGSLAENAVAVAKKIISGGAVITLGTYGSDVAIEAGPVFAEAGMPCIGVSCTNPSVTEGNDYYFRTCYLDPFQGTVLADFAYSLINE